MMRRWPPEDSVSVKATLNYRSLHLCYVVSQDVCTYLSPPGSPPQTLGAIGIGSSSPREHSIRPSFPSPRKQPHHPSFSAPEGPATLSCHLPPYMNTEHAQSWPSINVSTGNYRETLLAHSSQQTWAGSRSRCFAGSYFIFSGQVYLVKNRSLQTSTLCNDKVATMMEEDHN